MEIFSNPLLVVFYILSMIVVGSHLWHGVSSGFQSLGVDHPRVTPKLLLAERHPSSLCSREGGSPGWVPAFAGTQTGWP